MSWPHVTADFVRAVRHASWKNSKSAHEESIILLAANIYIWITQFPPARYSR